MRKFDEAWHRADVRDELQELMEAQGFFHRWSELSDVVYTVTRARWVGHKNIHFPLTRRAYVLGWLYMIPKYTLRRLFFWTAGKRMKKRPHIRSVRNPKKKHKLAEIADENDVDPEELARICKKQLRWWPLLK